MRFTRCNPFYSKRFRSLHSIHTWPFRPNAGTERLRSDPARRCLSFAFSSTPFGFAARWVAIAIGQSTTESLGCSTATSGNPLMMMMATGLFGRVFTTLAVKGTRFRSFRAPSSRVQPLRSTLFGLRLTVSPGFYSNSALRAE